MARKIALVVSFAAYRLRFTCADLGWQSGTLPSNDPLKSGHIEISRYEATLEAHKSHCGRRFNKRRAYPTL